MDASTRRNLPRAILLRLWHLAYCRWYDADRAGHRRRATAWGWLTDWLAV